MNIEEFAERHIGPQENEIEEMLKEIGVNSLAEMIEKTNPKQIRLKKELEICNSLTETEYLERIKEIAKKNRIFKSFIGMGYYETITPSVIQRNILENPSWYTSYTPYQAEISQGRLEALLNFQTVITELTGMEIANASLLDEATAASEAMIMFYNLRSREKAKNNANKFFVDYNIFPQTLDVLYTKAEPLGIEIVTGSYDSVNFNNEYFGCIAQYPGADGKVIDYENFINKAHKLDISVAIAADLLSLAILIPPREFGADAVVGSTQRFGIPMGFGGPHAAYFATNEKFKRSIPGRIIGVSIDKYGKRALRMALQTREQHIKRERATSNICTAQALLANMAGMYAVYHGPEGLKQIAKKIHSAAGYLSDKLKELGYEIESSDFFDTLKIILPKNNISKKIKSLAEKEKINFWYHNSNTIFLSVGESIDNETIYTILKIFANAIGKEAGEINIPKSKIYFNIKFQRKTDFLSYPVFNLYHSETDMMRYIKKLERKDYSLTEGMIPLGSCTMKLNAVTGMMPVTWPEFANIHPFAPENQVDGYKLLIKELEEDLKKITGFEAISFMPNSGAAGEYTGLMVIKEYFKNRGELYRNIVLIPSSAHGTNPASAVMAGMELIVVKCDEDGNIDINDLKSKAEDNKNNLCAFMVTYPSTHGVFEDKIIEMIDIIHENGGQVYMDGANLNAQVGLTNPAIIGADVCHINLHKTFGIPHGGGGPGMGPIGVAKHLVDFLPTHPIVLTGGKKGIKAVSAAPYGSANILPISHAYIKLLGTKGLKNAASIAILNANYIAAGLKKHYKILYTGKNGYVAHEFILDCREFKNLANITELDIAKRLMDYGFHAPTVSFPVHGTLMIEPTESEPKQELDRFIKAMISIYKEIKEIESGKFSKDDNVLINSPHTAEILIHDNWQHTYSRNKAAFPSEYTLENKYWPTVSRLQDAYGDRNLICTCIPIEKLELA